MLGNFGWENVLNLFSRAKKVKMADTSKDGPNRGWAEEYTTSQLHVSSSAVVNKFLLAYVILLKHVYFRQYFACLREIIFYCCKRITVKCKVKVHNRM